MKKYNVILNVNEKNIESAIDLLETLNDTFEDSNLDISAYYCSLVDSYRNYDYFCFVGCSDKSKNFLDFKYDFIVVDRQGNEMYNKLGVKDCKEKICASFKNIKFINVDDLESPEKLPNWCFGVKARYFSNLPEYRV